MITAFLVVYAIIGTLVGIGIHGTLDFDYSRKGKTVLTLAVLAGLFWPLLVGATLVMCAIEKALES